MVLNDASIARKYPSMMIGLDNTLRLVTLIEYKTLEYNASEDYWTKLDQDLGNVADMSDAAGSSGKSKKTATLPKKEEMLTATLPIAGKGALALPPGGLLFTHLTMRYVNICVMAILIMMSYLMMNHLMIERFT